MIDDCRTTNVATRGADWPPVGFGLASVVLGAIGLALFILPVIAIPINFAGIAVGVAGIVVLIFGGQVSLRLCVAGMLISLCGLLSAAAIARAPQGYFAPRSVFPTWRPGSDRPYVPPPAPPQGAADQS